MKKQLSVLLIAIMVFSNYSYSQSNTNKSFGIKWSGFVKTDFMFDSRQTVNAREGHFNILPASENLVNGEDLNDQTNINFLSIQSRLKASISGPDFFGMKTSGAIEGAFFGNSNGTTGEFRLRHAFVNLSNDFVSLHLTQNFDSIFLFFKIIF